MRPDFRLFNCERCHLQQAICSHCDRGQIYCEACQLKASRERHCKADERYQKSSRGRAKHAARQQRYLIRKAAAEKAAAENRPPAVEKMTDQGTQAPPPPAKLRRGTVARSCSAAGQKAVLCSFCGAPCRDRARLGFLQRRRSPEEMTNRT